jgi:thymidylate kinase
MYQPNPITIVIVGCYASGKSTLARQLSLMPKFQYFTEVGGELRASSMCRSSQSCSIFDELVMFRELERDKMLLESLNEKKNLVLEQWHIGNIAYAKVRNPQVAQNYISRLKNTNTLQQFSPIVIFLEMDPKLISERITYEESQQSKDDALFFALWQRELIQTFSELRMKPIRVNADGSPSKIYDDVISMLGSIDI